MAVTIGNLAVIISANGAGLTAGLSSAKQAVAGFAGSLGGTLTGLGIGGAISSGVGGLAGGLKSVAGALGQAGAAAVQQSGNFERAEIAMEAMLGSADKSKKFIGELAKFAMVTPFTFEDLLKASQRLLAFGFSAEKVMPILRRVGDLAAAMPEGAEEGIKRVTVALGQMSAKQRVMAQEMNQLTEAGIPAWEALAKELKTDVKPAMMMVERGQVDAATGMRAIMRLAEDPRFASMMEKQSKGLFGMWSNLKDALQLLLRDVGDIIVDAFDLKGLTLSITNFGASLRANIGTVVPLFQFVGSAFIALRDIVVEGALRAGEALRSWAGEVEGPAGAADRMRLGWMAAFETIALFSNKAILFVKLFARAVLVDAIAPIIDGLSSANRFMEAFAESFGAEDIAKGFAQEAQGLDRVSKGLKRAFDSVPQMAVDFAVAQVGILQFFDTVDAKARQRLGQVVKQAAQVKDDIDKLFPGAATGNVAAAGIAQRPAAAELFSREAASTIIGAIQGTNDRKVDQQLQELRATRKAVQDMAKVLGGLQVVGI